MSGLHEPGRDPATGGVHSARAEGAHPDPAAAAADTEAERRAATQSLGDIVKELTSDLSTLMRQEFNDQIPAGLPPGTPIAHKTGWITATLHDAAIVYPNGQDAFVLVILTRGIPDRTDAQRLTADITRLVWSYATRPTVVGPAASASQ